MLEIVTINKPEDFPSSVNKSQFIDFLFNHLDQFGDPKEDIEASIDYAFSDSPGMGGFLLAAIKDDNLVGALVMNNTGMKGYIPEHILVYIAVDASCRGQGIGGKIMDKALALAGSDVALHVEYDNPAKRLYERKGFKSKYAEMRYKKE